MESFSLPLPPANHSKREWQRASTTVNHRQLPKPMSLIPGQPDYRKLPHFGEMRDRRIIRGVGPAERALGYAWGSLTSKEREYHGNQQAFARAMQKRANILSANRAKAESEAAREKGRQSVAGLTQSGQGTTPTAPTVPGMSGLPGMGAAGSSIINAASNAFNTSRPAAPTTPTEPKRMFEMNGRQYPGDVVGDSSKRDKYDSEVEARYNKTLQKEQENRVAQQKVRGDQPRPTPQEALENGIKAGRVTNYSVTPEMMESLRKQREQNLQNSRAKSMV